MLLVLEGAPASRRATRWPAACHCPRGGERAGAGPRSQATRRPHRTPLPLPPCASGRGSHTRTRGHGDSAEADGVSAPRAHTRGSGSPRPSRAPGRPAPRRGPGRASWDSSHVPDLAGGPRCPVGAQEAPGAGGQAAADGPARLLRRVYLRGPARPPPARLRGANRLQDKHPFSAQGPFVPERRPAQDAASARRGLSSGRGGSQRGPGAAAGGAAGGPRAPAAPPGAGLSAAEWGQPRAPQPLTHLLAQAPRPHQSHCPRGLVPLRARVPSRLPGASAPAPSRGG